MKATLTLLYCLAFLLHSRGQQPAPRWQDGKRIRHIVMYGQSNMLGTTAVPVLSTAGVPMALMFNGGVRSGYDSVDVGFYSDFKPLVEKQVSSKRTGALLGETPASGCAEAIMQLLQQDNLKPGNVAKNFTGTYLLLSSPAQGSSSVAELSAGAYWNRFKQDIVAAHRLATAAKLAYDAPVIQWNQGERDIDLKTAPAEYKRQLAAFHRKANAFIRSVTGQKQSVQLLLYQTASHNVRKSVHDPSIAVAQYELAKTHPLITLSAPTYFLPYSKDAVHFSNVGSKWNGAFHGVAAKSILFDQKSWKPVLVRQALRKGKRVELRFAVPVPPLVFDTVTVTNPGNFGFAIIDGAGATIKIEQVNVAGDRVVIDAASPIPAGSFVWYGNNGTGTGATNGARGNLRDSQGNRNTIKIAGETKRLDNWAPLFRETLP